MPGDKPARDHIVALADGGENIESNFQILCGQCHEAKTSVENTDRAKVRSMKAKHLGIRKPSKFRKPPAGVRYEQGPHGLRAVRGDAR
jgi:hypothetical protein